jgi:competence ComEA-like helix-hairpin-helix protein
MNGANTTNAVIVRRNTGAKMLGVFALGAASCGLLVYTIVSKPPPAHVHGQVQGQVQGTQPGQQLQSSSSATYVAPGIVPAQNITPLPTVVVNVITPAASDTGQGVQAQAFLSAPQLTWPAGWDPTLVGPPPPPLDLVPIQVTLAPPAGTSPDEPTGLRSQSPPVPSPAPQPAAAGSKLNINIATGPQLELLPSIGPATAKRIIEYREANGPFKSAADLDKIKGIGEKTIAKILPYITFDSPPPGR